MFDLKKSIRLEIDASNLVIKACLNQKHEDKWHLITYFSRKFSSIKQNYDIHDKKLLAIIIVLKSWRIYVEKAFELKIFTNHKNLMHFIKIKQLNQKQIKWSKLFEQYKFTIQYTFEKDNDKIDALNKRSDHIKTKKIFNHNIFKINKNESISTNKHKLNAIVRILKDDQKQFLIEKKRLRISKKKSTKL